MNRICNYYPEVIDGDNMPNAPRKEPATALERKQELLAHHVRLVAQQRTNGLFVAGPPGLGKNRTILETLLALEIVPIMVDAFVRPEQLYQILLENQRDEIILLDTWEYWSFEFLQLLLSALHGNHGHRCVVPPPNFLEDLPTKFFFYSRIIFTASRFPKSKPFQSILRRIDVFKLEASNEEVLEEMRHLARQGFGMLSPAECHEVVDVIDTYASTRRLSLNCWTPSLNRREYALTADCDWRELLKCLLDQLPTIAPNRRTGVQPMIEVPADRLPIESATIPYTVNVDVDWPRTIDHKGARYRFTGKEGVRTKDNIPTAEYELPGTGRRAWLGIDGAIEDD